MRNANKCLSYILNKHYQLGVEIPEDELVYFCDTIDFLRENTNLEFESSCYVSRKNNIDMDLVPSTESRELKTLAAFIEADKKISFKPQSRKSIENLLHSNIIITKALASTFFKNEDLNFPFYLAILGKNYDKYIITYFTEDELNVINLSRSSVIESIIDYGSWIISIPKKVVK